MEWIVVLAVIGAILFWCWPSITSSSIPTKTRWKMSESAVVIQNLLAPQERHGLLMGGNTAASIATKLVANVWVQRPDILNGSLGQEPHKIAIAAIALVSGFDLYADDHFLKLACVSSLAEILKEVEINGKRYPFNALDNQLLKSSLTAFTKEVERNTLSH